jgi:hypothetical protein
MGTKVSGLEHVTKLVQSEAVLLDPDRLDGLYAQLGAAGAEDIICRAMEELAIRMAQCERMYRQEKWKDLRKLARSLVAISDQIGMTLLSRVASDVTRAVDDRDMVAIAATLSRLLRIGEKSLTQIWDLQDMTV